MIDIYHLHRQVCIILLTLGFINYMYTLGKWLYFYLKTKHNTDYLIVFFSMVICDLILLLNYIPFYIYSLIYNELPPNLGCSISSIVIIMDIVAYNGSIINISLYLYFLIVKEKKISMKIITFSIVFWWIIGICTAAYYYSINVIGNYKNLYCCISTTHTIQNSFPIFFFFLLSSSIMMIFYTKTYYHVKNYNVLHDNKHWNVAKRGVCMILCYYAAWFYVSFNAILDLNQLTYSLWNDIVASWLIKSSPLVNGFIFSNVLYSIYSTITPR
jgi:hypothetical protein